MKIFVTGATGFVGSAVVQELKSAGHQVLGLVRSEANARSLATTGAEVHRGSLEDADSLRRGVEASDGVIHTAYNHDFINVTREAAAEADKCVIDILGAALEGSGRPLVITSGIGHLANGRVLTETDVPDPSPGSVRVIAERAALSLATGREGLTMTTAEDQSVGMDYLESFPRKFLRVYLPLGLIVFFLLFPFYWMAVTTFKPDAEMYDYEKYNPFLIAHPTLEHVYKLFFETDYPQWMTNTIIVSVSSTFISLFASVCAAYAIERLRYKGARYIGLAIFLAYLVPPSILFIPLAAIVFQLGLFDGNLALILTYPTFLIPFCTWLLMGYFRTIPYELEECALIDGATRLQILTKITLPLALPGLISAGIFAFTLSWNEFIYALTFISSSENKTIPVGAITELVNGDVYHWGALMAAALVGSVPVVILYSFFVEYYVSAMTGAVKE